MNMARASVSCAMILLLTCTCSASEVSATATRSLSDAATTFDRKDSTTKTECDACGKSLFGDADCDSQSRFFVTAESLFLKLDKGTRQAVPVVMNQDTGETVLTTQDLAYDMVAGPRLVLGYRPNERDTIEASYFGLHHWNDSAEALGDNNLRLPGDLALATQDFFDADRMLLDYTSRLHNVEVNYFRSTQFDNVSFLMGFRYLNLNESFNIHANDVDAGGSDYSIDAYNRLYGGQFGGRWRKEWDRFGLDFVGKAGIYGNAAEQHTYVVSVETTAF